jgi:hypothetical protein
MEPEGSLPHSQEPAPVPIQSPDNPVHYISGVILKNEGYGEKNNLLA